MRRLTGQARRHALRLLRTENRNQLFWSRYEPRNFGDWIGPYLFNKITGRDPVFANPSDRALQTVTMSAGSIMRKAAENCVIWGSGVISRGDVFPRPHRVCAVRGPRTRERFHELGYECPPVFGDPAILLPLFYRPAASERRYRLGVVPHFVDATIAPAVLDVSADVLVIDVARPVEHVVNDICACDAVVSSSLHGLIVAHAYGIPAGWINLSDGLDGDGVKFSDHLASGGVWPAEPLRIRARRTTSDLKAFVRDSPVPDLAPLRDPLLQACPFIESRRAASSARPE